MPKPYRNGIFKPFSAPVNHIRTLPPKNVKVLGRRNRSIKSSANGLRKYLKFDIMKTPKKRSEKYAQKLTLKEGVTFEQVMKVAAKAAIKSPKSSTPKK